MTSLQSLQSYHLGAEFSLSEIQKRQLIDSLYKPSEAAAAPLGGRNAVSVVDLDGVGRVVIKTYRRGGFIRHFNRQTYLKLSETRGQSEYNLLKKMKQIGINAPDPIAFVYKGRLLYHAWLITREIAAARTLADLSRAEPERAQSAMADVQAQVDLLIRHHIHHVDLHPGNVLVDRSNQVYLIDFDKARTGATDPIRLRQKYVRRWQRAVSKHHLPVLLNRLLVNSGSPIQG
jgi:3-deoxy-D-manno-octulosonic acid kinase